MNVAQDRSSLRHYHPACASVRGLYQNGAGGRERANVAVTVATPCGEKAGGWWFTVGASKTMWASPRRDRVNLEAALIVLWPVRK